MPTTSVDISAVRKTFGPTVALGGASLRAYAGEVHAIVGGNGSGKSTMAKVISGVLVPDSGQVSILGRTATSPVEARQLGIANVFQEVLVADECSVLDNLYLGADPLFSFAMSREDKAKKAAKLLRELLGFDLDLHTAVGDLPLSSKQWITIARALLTDPKVLILDESSAALDFESTERLFRKMRQMKANGASVLIVTHRTAELVRIADRATVLRDGVDVGCLTQEEISEDRILELIAGPQRQQARASEAIPERLNPHPVLRIQDAKVWPDSSPINLTLYPGEIIGITGLDGQGQADFVRCVAGVQRLAAGRITAIRDGVGDDVDDLQSARENEVSYVSGDRKKEGIFANLSIFENLLLPVYRDYRAGGVLNIVDAAKLAPVFEWESGKLAVRMGSRDNPITSLSGGNQQKVLIARAFAEKPSVLVLNDPARGIDVGAKLDLYRNLKAFARGGKAAIFLSSEVEEFLDTCTCVHVFRNGTISSSFEPPYDSHVLLNAMFGRKPTAALPEGLDAGEPILVGAASSERRGPTFEGGRPMPRSVPTASNSGDGTMRAEPFRLESADIDPSRPIPKDFVEDSKVSPQLEWSGVPEGTQGFALAVTDPDLPPAFNFPRPFAHWLVVGLPPTLRALPRGASGTGSMADAKELPSDFVTFKIPGFGRGYGGPWPPDRAHRYVFTLYALKIPSVELADDADLPAFWAAVLPKTIETASFTAMYGPASKPLPA